MLPYMPVDMKPSPPRQRSQLLANLKVLWLAFLKMFFPLRWITNCQFRLSSLFLIAFLFAVAAAWIAQERRESTRQLALAQKLEELGLRVTLVKRFCTPTAGCGTVGDSWWQEWLGELCGERIVTVEFSYQQPSNPMVYADGQTETIIPTLADVYQLENQPIPSLEIALIDDSAAAQISDAQHSKSLESVLQEKR